MASLVCSISGTLPEEPVASRAGYVFERRVLEKYLQANDAQCPVTGEPLAAEDLIPLKAARAVRPRPSTAASIPGLLALLQSEWDALMAETFTLRTHVDSVRSQLAHSLYQHDAACRVIARLVKERDGLKKQLSQLQDQLAQPAAREAGLARGGGGPSFLGGTGSSAGSDEIGLSHEAVEDLKALAKTLLNQRKKRVLTSLGPVESVKTLRQSHHPAVSLHSSTTPGVATLALARPGSPLCPEEAKCVWTGGCDSVVGLFDFERSKTVARLQGHLKRVNAIVEHRSAPIVFTASDDKTVRVWNCPGGGGENGGGEEYRTSYILRKHNRGVTSLSLHPSGDYFATGSRDRTWGLHEAFSGRTCRMYSELPCEFTAVSFHPDGMLVGGCGTNNYVHIYDIKTSSAEPMVSLPGHTGPVSDLEFSENGYYLATCSEDGTVKLWDLRRSLNFETIDLVSQHPAKSARVPRRVRFDHTGSYLAVCCGGGVRDNNSKASAPAGGSLFVYHFESRTKMDLTVALEGHTDAVTDAWFGPDAKYLVSSSMDRTVRLWEPEESGASETSMTD